MPFAFFVPDDHIKQVFKCLQGSLQAFSLSNTKDVNSSAFRVQTDTNISACINSILSYFTSEDVPPKDLLKIKLQELIVSILLSSSNPLVQKYFCHLAKKDSNHIEDIMEANFRF